MRPQKGASRGFSANTGLAICLLAVGLLSGCTAKRQPQSASMVISLYSGVRGVVSIGDNEAALRSRIPGKPKRIDITPESELGKNRFSHGLFFPNLGTRAYFRNGRVALIQVQDPFRGKIQGHELGVFKLAKSKPNPWDEVIQEELGTPVSRTSGGRFGSEAFFYGWGDISFNANGPNEIAIYRDKEIAKFRQGDFGRKVDFFK